MIDTFKEKLLSIDAASKHISKVTRKKRNRNALMRWGNKGIAGVVLETIQIGGDIFTSELALNTFLRDSREAKRAKSREAASPAIAEPDADQDVVRRLRI